MNLKDWVNAERGRAMRLAAELGVSKSYVSQLMSGKASISPRLAVLIEQKTDAAVTRKDLFPADWHEIWPELVQGEGKEQ